MAANKIKGLTVEIGGDTTKLGKALAEVDKKSRDLSSELGEINKLLKFDPGNTELLSQKQKVLADAIANTSKRLATLEEAEKQVQEQFKRGEVSEEQVRALQREIMATSKKLANYAKAAKETAEAVKELGDSSDGVKDDLKKTEKGADKAADSLDDLADSADKAGDAGDGLGKKLGSVAKGGLAVLGAAVGAVFGALVGATEASREYRTEMGKLDVAFTASGHSSQDAYRTYSSLQSVLGETEQAVEAANHLAKLTDNEEDLAKWTDVCTGVYATFGASLPIEGLAEAANETAKVGQVTGPLADALNWAGVSEDAFNASLAACSDEQERQALILETLNGLYDEAAETYKEVNAEVIRANQANEEWNTTMADVGAAVEPVLTDVKLLGASLLADLVPGIERATKSFRKLVQGEEGAAEEMGIAISGMITHVLDTVVNLVPTMASISLGLISALTTTLLSDLPTLVSTLTSVATQVVSMLVTFLPQLIPVLVRSLITTATTLLETVTTQLLPQIVLLIGTTLPQVLIAMVNQLSQMLPQLVTALFTTVTTVLNLLTTQLLPQIVTLIVTLIDTTLPQFLIALVNQLSQMLPQLITGAVQFFQGLVTAITQVLPLLLEALPGIIELVVTTVVEAAPLLLEAAIQLFMTIVEALPVIIESLIENLPTIVDTIVTSLVEAVPILLEAAIAFLMAIIDALPTIIQALTENLPRIISTITTVLVKNLPLLISAAVDLFMGIVSAIPEFLPELVKQIPTICTAILEGLGEGLSAIGDVGKDLIEGLWGGIKDMTSWITGKLEDFGDTVLSGIKSFFGIESPSKVFKNEVGKMLGLGLAEGIEDSADEPIKAMADLSEGVLDEAAEFNGLTLERQLQHTFATPENAGGETSLLGKLDKILAAIERGQIIALDGDALVGATADRMDRALGLRRTLAAKGAI